MSKFLRGWEISCVLAMAVASLLACSSAETVEESVAVSSGALRPNVKGCASTVECKPGEECCAGHCALAASTTTQKLAYTASDQTLQYKCYQNQPSDVTNPPPNILPDYSWAGYKQGQSLPFATQFGPTILPDADNNDDTPRIQAALDACGAFVAANNVVAKAVVLAAGTFELASPLWIRDNGVVLRGAGQGPGPGGNAPHTILLSTRPSAHSLIWMMPHADGDINSDALDPFPVEEKLADGSSRRSWIEDSAVPAGATRLRLNAQPADLSFTAGEAIVIVRRPNNGWLADMGVTADFAGWREAAETVMGIETPCTSSSQCTAPRVCNKTWDVCVNACTTNASCPSGQTCEDGVCVLPAPTKHLRKVTQWNPTTRELRFDIPIVDPIYLAYGGGYVAKVLPARFIEKAGVEDLRIDAQFADAYPAICTNGTSTRTDDEFCGSCEKKGDTCTTAADCGAGYECSSGKCRCPCPGEGVTCTTNANCQSGTFCIDGTCQCPAPRGICPNGTGCNAADGDWNGIVLRRAKNSWVQRVTVNKYGMSAVSVGSWSSFNTIEEVAHVDPLSPLDPGVPCDLNDCANCRSNAGNPESGHRYSFNVGPGVGNLFQRLYARRTRHTFVTGKRGTGPHVWLDSATEEQMADIGPHHRYATGLLFDNIFVGPPDPHADCRWDNLGLTVKNSGDGATGHGWTGAQVMFWNGESMTVSESPPAARNWVVGGIARPIDGTSTGSIWELETTTVKPRSLYIEQLKMRDPLLWTTVVSPQQASRRIWDDLLRWKGTGKLSDYTADPSCLEGRPASNGPGCCPSSCSSCSDSNSNLACRPSLINSARSCATVGAPCLRPDPTCQWGTKFNNGSRCCPAGCTQCGGSGCGGAGPNCCVSTRKCGDVAAPCSLVDPECTAGVEGQSAYVPGAPDPVADRVCCDKSCAQCGGPGCGGAGTNCCMGSILSSGVACSGAMAPCVMD